MERTRREKRVTLGPINSYYRHKIVLQRKSLYLIKSSQRDYHFKKTLIHPNTLSRSTPPDPSLPSTTYT